MASVNTYKSHITSLVTYLDFIVLSFMMLPLICPPILCLHKLNTFGLSGGYLNWFRSYLTNKQFQVRVSEMLSHPSEVLSGIPQDLLRASGFQYVC
jgi:hypothetical protein